MQGYENYDLQEEDPYLLSGSTCLINRLGITNTQALNEAEAAISKVAFAELIANPIEPTFNLKHMCRIHHYLFSDIYEWAGQLRQTEISKGGQLFLPYRNIEDVAAEVFYQLQKDSFLRELDETEFAYKAAYYLGRVNMIHPFREGNGRVQALGPDPLPEHPRVVGVLRLRRCETMQRTRVDASSVLIALPTGLGLSQEGLEQLLPDASHMRK